MKKHTTVNAVRVGILVIIFVLMLTSVVFVNVSTEPEADNSMSLVNVSTSSFGTLSSGTSSLSTSSPGLSSAGVQASSTSSPSNPDRAIGSPMVYHHEEYGLYVTLPISWSRYTIVHTEWKGMPLFGTSTSYGQTPSHGPKLLIRNAQWTADAPYEDIPILIFTLLEWRAYQAEAFAISVAPIRAQELVRNNRYVFALPPRWDFDSRIGVQELRELFLGHPLTTVDVGEGR